MDRESPALYPKGVLTEPPGPCAQKPLLLGPDTTTVTCVFCQSSITTNVKHTLTTRTHMAGVLWCFVCLCCLPYAMNSTKNSDHYCPHCQKYLGTYQK